MFETIVPSTSYLTNEFRILNIPVTSGFREIKTAYRKLARFHHPEYYDYLSDPKEITRSKGNELLKNYPRWKIY